MVKNGVLLLGIIIIGIAYLRVLIIYFTTKNKSHQDLTGFDLAKELTSTYDEINIVESKEVYLSKYNIKRRVIRLSPKNYYGTDLFSLAISTQLSGYSLININQDKSLKIASYFLKNIDYLSKSSLLTILISLFTNTIGDAKIGITLLAIILIYQYFMIQINTLSNQCVKEELQKHLEKKEHASITKIISYLQSIHTVSFITTLIFIIREVLILLNM